jgi:polyvinyl alcohol dehydrogenase (cytochrome)
MRSIEGLSLARLVGSAAALLICAVLFPAAETHAAPAGARDWSGRLLDPSKGPFAAGAKVYQNHCAGCHDSGMQRAPQHMLLQDMTPRAIHRALTDGVMRAQGAGLSDEQKVAVAEYLANRKLAAAAATAGVKTCTGAAAVFDMNEPPVFAGWGLDLANTHRVPAALAGVNRENVGRLELKWAFAFPDATRARSQPALAGGAILVGSHNGSVYALDRGTGCVRWSFQAEAEVRTGIVVSPWQAGDREARPLAFFGDVVGNAYAVDALTGALAWKVSADDHPAATLTAAPTLYRGTLYVPVSSVEEASAASPRYACCSFRGSLVALDAATGKEKWRTYLADKATVRGTGADGVEKFGPSGVAVWNSPAIDAGRGQLYVATSDNYSAPATDLSDSIVALDLATGAIRWHYQALAGDMWNVACFSKTSSAGPENAGPDFGFGAAAILARASDGREYVLAGQKSGWAFAVDPDTGKLAWKRRVGRGGVGAGIYFGMAAADGRLFVPVTDRADGKDYGFPASPGLHALDIASGAFVWHAPAQDVCDGKPGCDPGYGSAITATSELVLTGADDGHMRIHDAATGAKLWDLDTTRAFPTVNGTTAHGGAIGGGAAPLVYKNLVLISSGYSYGSKMAGNLLLVYETD